MDAATMLRELETWPTDERLGFIEMAWEQMRESGTEPDLTTAQRADLDRRLAELDASPRSTITWEEIEQHVRRPR